MSSPSKTWRKEYRRLIKSQKRIRPFICDRLSGWKKKTQNSNLTVDYLEKLYYKQNKKCYYTGVTLEFSVGVPHRNGLSLDRKNPKKGYVKGNVVWCSYFVNTMKGNLTEVKFYTLLTTILKTRSLYA